MKEKNDKGGGITSVKWGVGGTDELQHFPRCHRQKIGNLWKIHEEPIGLSFPQHAKHQLDGFLSELAIPPQLEVSVTGVPLGELKTGKAGKDGECLSF